MTPLVRPEFRPKLWSPADLDAAAGHWLDLCRLASAVDYRDEHRTGLRLRGVANAGREAVAAALAARLPGFEVTRPDADTLAAVGPALDFETPPPVGLGVPQLTGPPFDGLYLEVRFMATARKRNGKPHAAGTLVLAGELGPDGFTVYAVWGESLGAVTNSQARQGPWADEQAWRQSLQDSLETGSVSPKAHPLAQRLFPSATVMRFTAACLWLALLPSTEQGRGAAFARKLAANLAANLAAVAVAALVLGVLPPSGDFFAGWKVAALSFCATPLAFLGVQFVTGWVLIRRYMSSMFAVLYSGPDSLVRADATEAASYFGTPSGRKCAADWAALGGRPLGDGTMENILLRHTGFCLLVAPDGVANVLLAATKLMPNPDGTVRNHFWPAQVFVMVITRYPDDSAVVSVNDAAPSFRRKLFGPEYHFRAFPGVHDPAELLTRHGHSCRLHADRVGQAPLPSMKFEDYVRWNLEHGDQERRLYARNPVTWSDAFVLLMGYVRRAYR